MTNVEYLTTKEIVLDSAYVNTFNKFWSKMVDKWSSLPYKGYRKGKKDCTRVMRPALIYNAKTKAITKVQDRKLHVD